MSTYDASTARCLIFTYKEGLLSRVAHDLMLSCRRFHLEWDEDGIRASFDPSAVRVLCAMKAGAEDHHALSAKDRKQIDDNIAKSVLHIHRHKEITFQTNAPVSRADHWSIDGTLTLLGRARPIRCTVVDDGSELTTRIRIHQPDFGIKPFNALMGAIRIKPEIDVVFSLPVPETP